MASLREALQRAAGGPLVGMTVQHVTSPWLARLWKHAGCDFVYVEYEHGFFNEADLAGFVLCCRAEGLPVVAKVPELQRGHVAKLLECGVLGIQLPWTETREQLDVLASWVKFPPLGIRAAAPGYGNTGYDPEEGGRAFIESANEQTVIVAHVETRTGVGQIEAIASHPCVDIVFLGMYDLSVSYGHAADFAAPAVADAASQVVEAAHRHGKVAGMWVPDADAARPWAARGVTFFETASEVDLIASGSRELVRRFRTLHAGRKP